MIAADQDALICDMAETYGVLDYRALPVPLLATLAAGLREDSRIKMSLSGAAVKRSDMLLAAAVDRLSLQIWQQSEDGRKGINRPKMVLDLLLGQKNEQGDSDVQSFETADEFEDQWEKITGVSHGER